MTHRTELPDLNTLNREALKALIVAQHDQLLSKDEQLLLKDEQLTSRDEEIERLKLLIAKLRRMEFGRKSEKIDWEIEQLELKLDELEASRAQQAAASPSPMAADGMTEQLIGELSQLSGLKVISRTSVMQYKGERKKGLPQIGRELNADAVMEGSVLRSGNRVRVTAHMIYARTDQNLLTETYEQDLGDVLKLQREVAESITEKVRLKLTQEEKARLREVRQVKSEAFDAYLRAMQFNWLGPQGLKDAQSYFIQAIQKDPGFPEAHGALASCYANRADGRFLSPQDAVPPAKQALRKALELDEKNCNAHLAQVWVSWRYDWDWAAADREFKYALELCPNSEEIHWTHTYYAAWAGHGAEALAELEKTRELDPLMTELRFLHAKGLIYYHLRDYKTMVEVGQKHVAGAGVPG